MRSHISIRRYLLVTIFLIVGAFAFAEENKGEVVTLRDLMVAIQGKAKVLENSSGMRQGFETFTAAYKLRPESVSYSDYVMVRLLFEATRDAGFWNLHWTITDQEPNSDKIWPQWKSITKPSPLTPTASAECDELSALYSFLVGRAGVKGVGLFWPYPNHTVAVWALHPAKASDVRVVVPTTQIFLTENDFFGARTFNPWKQKSIYEYRRRDVPDSYEIPKPLADFFLHQIDQYAGASNTALQRLRYLREGVFLRRWTPEQAASAALKMRDELGSAPVEDANAYWNFAQDMKAGTRQ